MNFLGRYFFTYLFYLLKPTSVLADDFSTRLGCRVGACLYLGCCIVLVEGEQWGEREGTWPLSSVVGMVMGAMRELEVCSFSPAAVYICMRVFFFLLPFLSSS